MYWVKLTGQDGESQWVNLANLRRMWRGKWTFLYFGNESGVTVRETPEEILDMKGTALFAYQKESSNG